METGNKLSSGNFLGKADGKRTANASEKSDSQARGWSAIDGRCTVGATIRTIRFEASNLVGTAAPNGAQEAGN